MGGRAAAEATGERHHDLDALRAFAILVVIVFHTAGVAMNLPIDGGRPVELSLWWLAKTASAFQMPLFFMLSGFFAAFTVTRAGAGTFVRGRLTVSPSPSSWGG